MVDLRHNIDEKIKLINSALDSHMPAEETRPGMLHKAMRYSVFAGGKRLRPLLCLAACEAAGGPCQDALIPAIAIEALHTYTLIHDDLPCMDNDDLRRGKPTCHIVFGESTAILAGDALLTLAFEWLAQVQALPPYSPNLLSIELAVAAGSRGLVGGQMEDIAAEGKKPDADLVEYIHANKTASLLRASVRLGGIAAAATDHDLNALTSYGSKLGLAFQIVDDILNETSSVEALGKASGTDRQHVKMTYVAAHGLDAARNAAARLSREALAAIQTMRGNAETLVFLAQTMMKRTC